MISQPARHEMQEESSDVVRAVIRRARLDLQRAGTCDTIRCPRIGMQRGYSKNKAGEETFVSVMDVRNDRRSRKFIIHKH